MDVFRAAQESWMLRDSNLITQVREKGRIAGYFKPSNKARCPIRGGILREEWLYGWRAGQCERRAVTHKHGCRCVACNIA